jgi:acyl-CoA synthetase (AMP-forming)/AMP-acid ligase II
MQTLVDLLRERAAVQGDRLAFLFLEDGAIESHRMTYAELDERARAVAARLQEIAAAGERALVIYPAGLDFLVGLFGCLYAGLIGIPTPPPEASRLKRTRPRLQSIAADARASLVLTTRGIQELLEPSRESIFGDRPPRWLATDGVVGGGADAWRAPRLCGRDLAYLQYTSGSTAEPKGVMIAHETLLFYVEQLQQVCRYTPESVTVSWLPNFHDYGLVQALLEPLYSATPSYVMSPFAFVKRPASWLHAITRYRATHSQAPNFAYDLCARRIGPESCQGLDLSSWRAAGNAAELINPKVLDAFCAKFGPYGFRRSAFCPGYGLAEAVLLLSSSLEGEDPVVLPLEAEAFEEHRVVATGSGPGPARAVVGCGQVFPTTRMVIVDPDTKKRCAPDEVGEIWVRDPAVTDGYWERPEETQRIFHAALQDLVEGPFLRTGDLGFLRDNEIFVVGRIKDLIIIRGTNHHPQDIEWTVQAAHPALRPENGAAFSVLVDQEERLVIAQEVELEHAETLPADEIARVVRGAVAESHDLNVFALLLLRRGSLPKTASGKLQRQACRRFFVHGGSEVLAWWLAPTRDLAGLPTWLIQRSHRPAGTTDGNGVPAAKSPALTQIGTPVEPLSPASPTAAREGAAR